MPVETGQIVYLVSLLVLVMASLMSRRLPISYLIRSILLWILIFIIIFGLFSYKSDLKSWGTRILSAAQIGPTSTPDGRVTMRKAPDGHFWVPVMVNGVELRFMVDSGATTTAISASDAAKAGLDVGGIGFPALVETANGVVEMRRARVQQLQLGSIRRTDFPVLVSDRLGDTNLLGMNFLSTLKRWEMSGDQLILTP